MGNKNEVVIRFLGDASQYEKTAAVVDKETGKIGGAFSKLGGIVKVGALGLATGALAALPSLNKTGNALESMAAKAETVFGGALGSVEKWAKTNANAMGVTRREAAGLAADFADLLVPMGFTQKQAAKMSTDVVGLSGALSAWSNGKRTAAEVSTILSKAMLGERDGLKELGISISEADVQGRLLAKGQQDLTGAALEQAKAVATSELIFEKSKDAQRAFADSTKTNTEQALIAKGRMNELKDSLAVGLVPVFAKATQVGLGVVDFLTNLSPTGQAAIGVVVGLAAAAFAVVNVVKAWTAAQEAFNVVMSLNPVALIVIGVAALAAGLVVAYKNSETFRNIVQGVFAAVKGYVSAVVGAVEGLGRVLSSVWGGMSSAARAAFNAVARLWNGTVGKLSFKVPSWVPGLGGKGWEVPNIPVLHKGGIFRAPTPGGEGLALLKDRERVLTEDQAGLMGGVTVIVQTGQVLSTAREVRDAIVAALEEFQAGGGRIGDGRGRFLQPT